MDLENFFDERNEIASFLGAGMETSLLNVYQTDLPKILVVAAASKFELKIIRHIEDLFQSMEGFDSAVSFVSKKALFRQYHQLFSWNDGNIKTFTNFFGAPCAVNFKKQILEHDWLERASKDFLELGRARNELVHGDFASHALSLTPAEVRVKYQSALRFVDVIPRIIRVEDIE